MKTGLNRLALLLALSALLVPNAAVASGPPGRVNDAALEHAQGAPDGMVDLILTYRSAPGKNDRNLIESQGGKVKHKFVTIPGHAIRVPARALRGLSHNPNVHWISLHAPVASMADTSVNGVRTTIDMSLAEGLGLTGAGVTVAVLDSGVAAHSDLTPLQQVDIIAPYSTCGHRSARIERGLTTLYSFDAVDGSVIHDVSGVGPALDLNAENPERIVSGDDGLSVVEPTRLSNATDVNKIYSACRDSNEITVEAWLVPDNTTQDGPARIVTLSLDPYNRNFTLGQSDDRYQFRLRTTTNGSNGMYTMLHSPSGGVSTSRQHVTFTRDASGSAALYLDGVLVESASIGGDFSNWNSSYDFAVGNEFSAGSTTTARDWLGRLEMVAVSCEALSAAEVQQNFETGSAKADTNECVAPVALDDAWGHGTHIAGIIAGDGSGSGGAWAGMAPAAGVISLRVLDEDGKESTSDVIAGLDWIFANKDVYDIKVANLSLGHPIQESVTTDPLVQAVEFLSDAGIVVVCSAGNSGANGYGTITSPGNSPKVITVGSVTHWGNSDPYDDTISTFSSRGPTLLDQFVKPDLVTPGNRIVSGAVGFSGLEMIVPEQVVAAPGVVDKDYLILSGTSMSAAAVSGAAALMLEQDSTLTPATIKARLMRSATKFDTGDPFMTGAGMLNVTAALQELGVVDGDALSPTTYRDDAAEKIGFDNTGSTWGDHGWSQSIIWGDSMVWGDAVNAQSAIWGE